MRAIIFAISLIFTVFSANAEQDTKQDAGQPQNVESVTVLAPSSLTIPISLASKIYSREHVVDVNAVFENTSELLYKIEDGDPADIVITSSAEWMDKLQVKGLIDPNSRTILAKNRVSLVTAKGFEIKASDQKLESLLDFIHSRALMVMAQPDEVTLGTASKEILQKLGKWNKFRRFSVIAPTSTKTVDLIIKSETAGMVYTSDAVLYEEKLNRLGAVPERLHTAIEYHAALVVGNNMLEAKKYLTFLGDKKVEDVFKTKGFMVK